MVADALNAAAPAQPAEPVATMIVSHDMGAQIILCDPHRATVIGLDHAYPLRGIRMTSPDIRAGVALLIAALSAEGTSYIDNAFQIDRGYERIDERLTALGARLQRL
jgi:UDP-N-acetylglucosamine 1-carboxyvinyltransferase